MDTVLIVQFAVALLFSLSVHEAAHAWSADKLGDPTARELGRITLNPIAHIDPVMTLLLPALMLFAGLPPFGAAKPVPVDTRNLAHPKRDHAWIAAAGPISNLILAVISAVLFRMALGGLFPLPDATLDLVVGLLQASVMINVLLAAFNLLPIPPLDGSWILSALLPGVAARAYRTLQPYGFMILVALIWTGVLGTLLRPVMSFANLLMLG